MSRRKEFTELLDDEQLELDRQKLQSMKEIFGCKLDMLRENYIDKYIELTNDEEESIAVTKLITVYKVFEFLKGRL